MAVTQATLVVAQLDDAQTLFRDLGDAKAFPVAARFFEIVGGAREGVRRLAREDVRRARDRRVRAPGPAVEAALALQAAVDAQSGDAPACACRVAVHRGPMMALTQGGRLDYFGQNVELALALAAGDAARPSSALTSAVCQDVGVAERLQTLPDHLGMQPLAGGGWVLHVRAPSSGIVPVSAA